MLLGNQSVLNKSLARFTNGTATAGAYAANTRANYSNPAVNKSRIIYWSSKQSLPDGYKIGDAIFPPLKSGGIASTTNIAGAGALTAAAISAKLAEALLSGSGDLSAGLSVITPGAATIAGTGAVSADVQAVSALTVTITGSGSISADLSAVVPMEAVLSGQASLSPNLTGLGKLEASITPFADLSPQSLASAVMNSTVETGYNLEEALRLILSAVAGKVSGAGGSTITIRSVTDGTSRIVATVDSNGNRSSIVYDVGDE